MGQGQNTIVNIIVNEPGQNNPVPSNIVEDALHQTIQEDSSTLQLAIVNAPMVSDAERENALRVRLHNARADEVSMTLIAKEKFLSSIKRFMTLDFLLKCYDFSQNDFNFYSFLYIL